MNGFKLPPESDIKWAHPGNRHPLKPYPVIPCDRLLSEIDFQKINPIKVPGSPLNFGFQDSAWSRDVYFIKGQGIPHVKIGRARGSHIDSRLAELQTGSPVQLNVLMVIDCGPYESHLAIEARIHEMFKEYRIHGEWFMIAGDLKRFLDESGCTYA